MVDIAGAAADGASRLGYAASQVVGVAAFVLAVVLLTSLLFMGARNGSGLEDACLVKELKQGKQGSMATYEHHNLWSTRDPQ